MRQRLRASARAARDDVQFALRLMRRSPRFFVGLILIASLGVGATTAMASLVQATLLRPLPFPDAERLVMLWSTRPTDERVLPSLPDALEWKQAQSFERLAVGHEWIFGMTVPGSAPSITVGALVSGDFFPALGVKPLLGRLLRPEDDGLDQPCRAVFSERFFRTRFGARASLVGSTVELDGQPCSVVGIAEAGFEFALPQYQPAFIWATLSATWPDYSRKARVARDEQEFQALAKLRPGVSLASSNAELALIAQRIAREHPGHQLGVRVTPLQEDAVSPVRHRLWGLFAAIGAVFLAACANIAGLFLVRAQTRRGEFLLRSALGASRWRLARQLLTEMGLVFVIATPGAWLSVRWFIALFTSIATLGSLVPAVTVNDTVFLSCLALSCATGLLFGLGPALALSQVSIGSGLADAGTGSQGSRHQLRLRAGLVVAQIAVACALAALSSIAIRAVAELLRRPGGFDAQGLVVVSVSAPERTYPEQALVGLYQRLFEQLRARPGVRAVTACNGVPMRSMLFEANFARQQAGSAPPARTRVVANLTPPGFFDVMAIPQLAGRDFVAEDSAEHAPRVALINETLRARFFPNEDPVGQWLQHDFMDNTAPAQIVGVVGDVRRFGLQVEPTSEIYVPFGQLYVRAMDLVLRVEPEQVGNVAQQLPGWIAQIEPQLPVSLTRVLTGGFERSVQPERSLSGLLSAFAVACLTLAALGTYAAVAYAASQRTREYGIRAALGASSWSILWLVLAAVLRWVAVGVSLALAGVLVLGGLLSQQIVGAPAFELRSFLFAAGVVALVALSACIAPALRAVRIAPATALRRE